MIHVAVSGAAGRMGRTLIRLIADADDLELVAALEAPLHPCLGQSAGAEKIKDRVGALADSIIPALLGFKIVADKKQSHRDQDIDHQTKVKRLNYDLVKVVFVIR